MIKQYSYKALDRNTNKKVSGTIEASSEMSLEKLLLDNNLILINCREVRNSALFGLFKKRITIKELITLFITLEQLEKAGVPVIESLRDMKEFTDNEELKDIGQDLYETVKNGSLLSEAMAKHKKIFDEVSISLVGMGEKTGNLEIALKNIVENIKWSGEIRRKTKKAITGPIFTLVFMLIIAVAMLKLVVPTVLSFVTDQGMGIPKATKALMTTSAFLENNFLMILMIPILILIIIKIFVSINKKFAILIDDFKLKLPIFGELIKKIELSRFAKFFGITFTAGIPVLECIDITIKVVKNKAIKNELVEIKEKIMSGTTISQSLRESGYFPGIVIRMFKIGEDSGNMEEALQNINYFYDTEINDTVDVVIASLKPVVMCLMGGLLIWLIVGVFGPIYGSFSNLI